VTASVVYPVVYGLLTNHLLIEDSESEMVATFKTAVSDSPKRRLMLNDDTVISKPAVIAAALDPRHKQLKFLSRAMRCAAKEHLYQLLSLS